MTFPIARHRFWIPTQAGAVAACLHAPRSLRVRGEAVVICPPFGYEYTHSHRSLLHLADRLAESGFAALRLDYVGSGDSEGDAWTPDLVERWVAGVAEAATRIGEVVGGAPPSLVGLRFGCFLAGTVAHRLDVRNFIAWHPVSSGKQFLREMRALQRVAGESNGEEGGVLEAGGFVLNGPVLEAIERVDAASSDLRILGQALVLERDDLGPERRFAERLTSQGVPTRVASASGYLGMMAEPQYTVVPEDALAAIAAWMEEVGGPPESVDIGGGALNPLLSRRTADFVVAGPRITEEIVDISADPASTLAGVLTRPPSPPAGPATVVVLANSGSVHHVGPNRLYVELARELALRGTACLRMDLRNLGDSRIGAAPDENHPYPETAVADVAAAVDWLVRERGYARCAVAGLCSGAHTAFHAGLELESYPIAQVICLNPLTFDWKAGMSLDTPDTYRTARDARYYRDAVRSWSKWRKLLTGRADIGYILRFSLHRADRVVRSGMRMAGEQAGLLASGTLSRWLGQYQERGRSLHFVFSSTDPGYEILVTEGGSRVGKLRREGALTVDFVEGADHTFSRAAWRRRAAECVAAALGVGSIEFPQPR